MSLANRRLSLLLASASLLAACAPSAQVESAATHDLVAAIAPAQPVPAEAAPVSALVSQVSIPHQSFVLDNGLTVIVHEDRKAPVVAVSMWYNVGSKDEPKGKTGFAHLFEHIMFNGSENLPGEYFEYLDHLGATDVNGTTWFDRTNYFETVPRGALERALFMESDRMGHLLGAVTQGVLDNQIGVVQNEKREGDNRPGGLVDYEVLANLFPDGHPYQHDTIGSMADLDSASLRDVKQWFLDKYGPNNAVLVLAGDINAAEARPLVERQFASIPRGPVNNPAAADVPTLAAPKSIVMKDRVAAVQVQRHWAVPGLLSDQLAALDLGGSILGGLASSRLDRILVREEKLAVSVSAGLQPFHRIGLFQINATVKPGVDPAVVEKRLDEIMADYLANGPTDDEVRRAATQDVAGRIRGLEQVGGFGGKAVALAEGQVYAQDSDFYKKNLDAYAAATPAQIRTAMQQWLSRPAFSVRLEPGDRPPYVEAKGVKNAKVADIATKKAARVKPAVGETPPLDFPDVQHVILSNGMKLAYAQRTTVPVTQLAMSFDAGFSADVPGRRGLQNLTLGLLREGADGMSSQQIAEEQERLGATISAAGTADRSNVTLSALSANLGPSLDLLADVVQRPEFAQSELDRVRAQTLTAIAQAQKEPGQIAARALPALLYGEGHPYATTNLGDVAAVTGFTRDDLVSFHQSWLRPDNVELFVVSNLPLAEVQSQLESRFGNWSAPAAAKGVKNFGAAPARPATSRIVLIDRPGSPQSVIRGGQLTSVDPFGDVIPVTSANDALGGNFLARINMDLRETKGWSYGAFGGFGLNVHAVPYQISAPVQADRTADSIKAINEQLTAFLSTKGITQEEITRTVASSVQELPGRFETGPAVLGAMMTNSLYRRPDNYYELLAPKYRALTQAGLDQSIRAAVSPNGFVWVVVGDAAKVKPQLDKLGIPVEVIEAR
ncbi:insulinase family protein [Sphingomonas sp. NSE70-1]|uniref:Insulinase family protein n=1 Tax=Sphingomonas caseinilyticus TaxID=2908205 RepID=A0ABT0RUN3_9SPHN|nr:pitrilysin family protein [Sphingomonas caseinilyticus]MCL6698666.1 insulinase family protein [Sphingomonas caseinilyticus]